MKQLFYTYEINGKKILNEYEIELIYFLSFSKFRNEKLKFKIYRKYFIYIILVKLAVYLSTLNPYVVRNIINYILFPKKFLFICQRICKKNIMNHLFCFN